MPVYTINGSHFHILTSNTEKLDQDNVLEDLDSHIWSPTKANQVLAAGLSDISLVPVILNFSIAYFLEMIIGVSIDACIYRKMFMF